MTSHSNVKYNSICLLIPGPKSIYDLFPEECRGLLLAATPVYQFLHVLLKFHMVAAGPADFEVLFELRGAGMI